jgi:signal peptidase II
VRDFLYFKLIDFPVFNVADSYVTVGLIMLIILVFFVYDEKDFDFLPFMKEKDNEQ